MKDNVIKVNFVKYKNRKTKKFNIFTLIKTLFTSKFSSTDKNTLNNTDNDKKIINYSKYIS
ncbi:hypothetical protein ACSVC9_15175 [Clostridium sp. LBM24168]